MVYDKAWLRDNLVKALGWDQIVAEEIVEAIAAAGTEKERDDLVQGYLGGGPKVKSLVNQFSKAQSQPQPSNASDLKGREQKRGLRQGGSVTVRHVPGRNTAGRGQESRESRLPEKLVCNCISCGKIYHTRSDTAETALFLASGGSCTFCGAQVALNPGSASQSRTSAGSTRQTMDDGAQLDQNAAAVAFKDRLVDYDRNARQRTTVVDDQNDYFEIDTNAWLDPEEREQLKRQEREMQEAEEARRKQVTVTLDLLGRQVLLADEGPLKQQAGQAGQQSEVAALARAAERSQKSSKSLRTGTGAASRITPNTAIKTERPIFIPTTPESTEERQRRRGVAAVNTASAVDAPKSVIGGWGDEKASTSKGSGLGLEEAQSRQKKPKTPSRALPPEMARSEKETKSSLPPASIRKSKRPQLKRVQHDNPFEVEDVLALDDFRLEEIEVQ